MKVLFKKQVWEGLKIVEVTDLVCLDDINFIPRKGDVVRLSKVGVEYEGVVTVVTYDYRGTRSLQKVGVNGRLEIGGESDGVDLLVIVCLREHE